MCLIPLVETTKKNYGLQNPTLDLWTTKRLKANPRALRNAKWSVGKRKKKEERRKTKEERRREHPAMAPGVFRPWYFF